MSNTVYSYTLWTTHSVESGVKEVHFTLLDPTCSRSNRKVRLTQESSITNTIIPDVPSQSVTQYKEFGIGFVGPTIHKVLSLKNVKKT